jgi:hypothetical protein
MTLLFRLTFVFVITMAVVFLALGYQAKAYKQAAIGFWGEQYDPSENERMISFGGVLNYLMPTGGPMIGTSIPGVCPDTPLPMVPIKVNALGEGQVLCGFGSDTIVMGFNVDGIEDPDLREALRQIIRDEYANGGK